MNSMQSIDISGFKSGVQKNKKPFLIMDDAFYRLENAYCWREEIRKREGLKLIGRLRRSFEAASIGNSGASVWNINTLYSLYATPITAEATAEIEPGSVIIIIGGAITFTDQGNGLLTSATPGNSGYIDYLTGNVYLTHTAGAGVATTAEFAYFPGLPSMGIHTREISGVNSEETLWFDTKYCYKHDGADFNEYLPASGVTWNGTDSDFFWTTNYRGSEAQTKLFFVTNFVVSDSVPMRYTNNTTWSDFKPITNGLSKTDQMTTTLASGSATFGPQALTNLPIVEGTLIITVTKNDGEEEDIIFRDTPKDGTLVSSGSNTGTITYADGMVTLNFNPVLPGSGNWTVTAVYNQGGTLLLSARILIPYYGRLIALNTWEGTTENDAVNIPGRCRFSQIGNPVQQDAWRSDVFGKGGFVDAPINEEIVSARFYKNTLIVYFERSTWRLQYLGEYGLPFIWERISSDFGSESTFSTVLFDNGVLAVGDKAIVGSSGSDVQRIDLEIPDTVFTFSNSDEGLKRVHGIRDFKKELVYWCYGDYDSFANDQYFPNKTLVYNYRNNTFAFFRNNVTCYGYFQSPTGVSWDRTDVFWDDNVSWDDPPQPDMPLIVSGNQQGFAHFYGYPDVETGSDSNLSTFDQESLSVTGVTVGSTVSLTIINHNLINGDIIYLTGLNYIVTATPAAGSTTLNDQIYQVVYVDVDTIIIEKWDQDNGYFVKEFDVTNVGDYVGGGLVALFPNIYIETKDFNPVKQALGLNIKTSYIDFLFDVSSPSAISVLLQMNAVAGDKNNITGNRSRGNLLVGNQSVETANSKTGYVQNITQTASPTVIVTSRNHGLLTGDNIYFQDVGGSTELNGNAYTITFLTTNTFSVSEAGISAYTFGGVWKQNDDVQNGAVSYFTLNSQYTWHRFFATCFGQYLRLVLTYSPEQMAQISTHQQNFSLNAMKIWYRPGGRNIFGK